MNYLDESSLANTLDRVNESLFLSKPIPTKEKEKVTSWIINRLGLKGSYAGLFAPTKQDYENKTFTFTGEEFNSQASLAHILGEESMRVLKKLDVKTKNVKDALETAKNIMEERIRPGEESMGKKMGMFCCGKCTVSYWRSLTSGCLDYPEERLSNGLKILKKLRDGKGKWRRFPFYYTLLGLSEIDLQDVNDELRYVESTMEKSLKHLGRNEKFDPRRKVLLERLLSKI